MAPATQPRPGPLRPWRAKQLVPCCFVALAPPVRAAVIRQVLAPAARSLTKRAAARHDQGSALCIAKCIVTCLPSPNSRQAGIAFSGVRSYRESESAFDGEEMAHRQGDGSPLAQSCAGGLCSVRPRHITSALLAEKRIDDTFPFRRVFADVFRVERYRDLSVRVHQRFDLKLDMLGIAFKKGSIDGDDFVAYFHPQ